MGDWCVSMFWCELTFLEFVIAIESGKRQRFHDVKIGDIRSIVNYRTWGMSFYGCSKYIAGEATFLLDSRVQ